MEVEEVGECEWQASVRWSGLNTPGQGRNGVAGLGEVMEWLCWPGSGRAGRYQCLLRVLQVCGERGDEREWKNGRERLEGWNHGVASPPVGHSSLGQFTSSSRAQVFRDGCRGRVGRV